jgi:hypothetical protein
MNKGADMRGPAAGTTAQSAQLQTGMSVMTKFGDFYRALDQSERRMLVELLSALSKGKAEDTGVDSAFALDSLSELAETESLMLQMLMDRLSKFEETISNVLKKIADTQDAIIANLK